MSVEGDKLVYLHSMVKNAFDCLYQKKDNSFRSETAHHGGLTVTGGASSSDKKRVLIITVEIPK